MENIEKNIKDFLYTAEFGENKSFNTIKSMKKDLSQLKEYLKEIEKIENAGEITPVMLRGFLLFLQNDNVGKRSINRKLSSLRAFFKYLMKNSIIKNNPIENWKTLTYILYAEKDNITELCVVDDFVKKFNCHLTIVENGEHWFHTPEQIEFLKKWIKGSA